MDGMTVPEVEMAVAVSVHVMLSVVLRDHVKPEAVPF
jgi:hypothetical protein